jgi:ABC-type multidrug transport system fused ATPase/permease subunit
MINLLTNLWPFIKPVRKRNFFLLIALMFIVSIFEIFSIGAVIPFLGVLTNPDKVYNYEIVKEICKFLGYTSSSQIVFPVTIVFALAAMFAALMRLLLLWLNSKFIFNIGKDISFGLYHRVLYQPYTIHISRNSSDVINTISSKVNSVIFSAIMPTINFISSLIMLTFVLGGLLYFNFLLSLILFLLFGLIYFLIIKLSRKNLYENSKIISDASSQQIKILQEGLGGIRDIIIDKSQMTFCYLFQVNDINLRAAQARNTFISTSPRFLIEGLGIVLMAFLAYVLAKNDSSELSIATLGVLAFGAQRILPLLQQIYWSLTEFRGNQDSLRDVLSLLSKPIVCPLENLEDKAMLFERKISFKQASFNYPAGANLVINKLDLTIHKGERIGIVGKTGSGKSTFLDLLMGLLTVTNGSINVDDVEITSDTVLHWQKNIAHVPQVIYLKDSSIAANIAFSSREEDIDYNLVRDVARKAQLEEVIDMLPRKYETFVGERGVKLSGGQRQRIGIARALYRQAAVIVLDEATSALDNDTETSLMDSIYELDKDLTIFIVAHRLSTLKKCDRVIEITDGKVKEVT